MANLDKHHRGGWRIRFTVGDKRSDFYPGKKLTKTQARDVCNHIAKLERSVDAGVDADTSTLLWVQKLSDKDTAKLESCGLIDPEESANSKKLWTLAEFFSFWEPRQLEQQPSTRKRWKTVYGHLVKLGYADEMLRKITEGDAKYFVSYLKSKGTAESSIRRYSGIAKQILEGAVSERVIGVNPFRKLKTSAPEPNKKRQRFISTEASEAILNACPDWEWRLIFGLMRWGGVRCPSEMKLKWCDVLWDKHKFLVNSPKTAHHEGGESRWVPIFKELEPLFRDAFENAADGAEYLLDQRRHMTHRGFTKQYLRILKIAGVSVYPKPFQNLRATRATELVSQGLPAHLESDWFGHTEKVANTNYLFTQDADFANWSGLVPQNFSAVPQKVPQTVADD
jgi:integrase